MSNNSAYFLVITRTTKKCCISVLCRIYAESMWFVYDSIWYFACYSTVVIHYCSLSLSLSFSSLLPLLFFIIIIIIIIVMMIIFMTNFCCCYIIISVFVLFHLLLNFRLFIDWFVYLFYYLIFIYILLFVCYFRETFKNILNRGFCKDFFSKEHKAFILVLALLYKVCTACIKSIWN